MVIDLLVIVNLLVSVCAGALGVICVVFKTECA